MGTCDLGVRYMLTEWRGLPSWQKATAERYAFPCPAPFSLIIVDQETCQHHANVSKQRLQVTGRWL